jgi:aryl-alcohol dehydrogenase-like predicted oxidoreductase
MEFILVEIMKQFPIAETGVTITPIGLGTVKLGRNQGVKYPNAFKIPDDKTAANLIAHAKFLGINLIDTAPAYGESEKRLGYLLKGQRKDWVICGKVGEEFENGQSTFNFTPEFIQQSCNRSLQRLNTEYIDIMLVHSDGNDIDIINNYGVMDVLADLKKQGLIRAFGMSTKTVAGGLLAAEKSDVVMVSYNTEYQDEAAVIDYCANHKKGILIKKAFGSGHLCKNQPIQKSMEFIFSKSGITSIIVGTINLQHLEENVSAVNVALSNLN